MNYDTILKLRKMRLPALAAAYNDQAKDPDNYASLSFDERFTLLVDAEFDARTNNKVKRLLKGSHVPDTTAYLSGIEYLPDRHLDKDLFATFRSNEYIQKGLNIMLIGATGCGKTYIACALATMPAVMNIALNTTASQNSLERWRQRDYKESLMMSSTVCGAFR